MASNTSPVVAAYRYDRCDDAVAAALAYAEAEFSGGDGFGLRLTLLSGEIIEGDFVRKGGGWCWLSLPDNGGAVFVSRAAVAKCEIYT